MASLSGVGVQTGAEPHLSGVCAVPLTRAVLRYRDPGDRSLPGGRIDDIGLGVVLEGRDPARAQLLELGSGNVRTVVLDGPLVILDWVFSSTLRILEEGVAKDPDGFRRSTFSLAMGVLEQSGFSPLTLPLLLRIGFRDLARDLDLHEGTAVRLLLPGSRVARIHMEYETITLTVRTGVADRTPVLEEALRDAFPEARLHVSRSRDAAGIRSYHLPFQLPHGVSETRSLIRRVRRGLLHLLARFEPARYEALQEQVETFGVRDSLRRLRDRGEDPRMQLLGDSPARVRSSHESASRVSSGRVH